MDYLRRDLRQSGLFLAVVGPGSSLPPTHQLEGLLEKWMEVDTDRHWLAARRFFASSTASDMQTPGRTTMNSIEDRKSVV